MILDSLVCTKVDNFKVFIGMKIGSLSHSPPPPSPLKGPSSLPLIYGWSLSHLHANFVIKALLNFLSILFALFMKEIATSIQIW